MVTINLKNNSIIILALIQAMLALFSCSNKTGIDREVLVKRHIPTITQADSLTPFTVGNGEFAFTVGITGLQTFSEFYENGIPFGTQSQWGWHSVPNTNIYRLEQTFVEYDTYGRNVSYAAKQHSDAGQWLRANPHRLHLGRIGFKILKQDGAEIDLSDVTNIEQTEDIWKGIIYSSFSIEGNQVNVETACNPDADEIGVRIKSGLLDSGRIAIAFDFPYASLEWGKKTADWDSPGKHSSEIIKQNHNSVDIERTLDSTKYFVDIDWTDNGVFERSTRNSFILKIMEGTEFSFTTNFSEEPNKTNLLRAEELFAASESHWNDFWMTGGAIDLSGSTDPRAFELERRIILSRYLTAIQCAGSMPPQETGLTFNSWYGKFHLEMHWWHGVHFALWGKPELFEKSLGWYREIFPQAKKKAARQGYKGARWPKMVGYDGRESPSTVGVFLIWQQPHPIYYAELLYRLTGQRSVLDKYRELVFETAEFLASYAQWDSSNSRYVLGPPLIPAQEIYKPEVTMNPAFELSYWQYGLRTAQNWRERLGLDRVEKWDDVISHLAKLPMNNGLYQNAETALNTFEDSTNRNDHPTVLGAFGMLPNDSVDIKMMERTLEEVMKKWNWNHTWGWDYPLAAMTAARVGRPDLAIEALMMNVRENTYLVNGHNYQDERLPVYLPGNGGLLTAVAMMAAGWDGAPDIKAPGFPKDGKWNVKYEEFNPLP